MKLKNSEIVEIDENQPDVCQPSCRKCYFIMLLNLKTALRTGCFINMSDNARFTIGFCILCNYLLKKGSTARKVC